MNELSKCPFCGSSAKIITVLMRHTTGKKYKVYCINVLCNVRTQETPLKREAIAQWNRRMESEQS